MTEQIVGYDKTNDNIFIEKALSFKIKNVSDFEQSGELCLSILREKKELEKRWKPLIEKAKASYEEIRNSKNKEIARYEGAETFLAEIRRTFKMEQDGIERAKQEKLEREAREKAEKERQALLDKAAEMEKANPKKAEAILEKAEAVVEKPVFVEKVVAKTTKMESGGSITWIDDIEVTVTDAKQACAAVSNGWIPTTCVEFKGLKAWAKAIGNKPGDYYGLRITKTQRESKRT